MASSISQVKMLSSFDDLCSMITKICWKICLHQIDFREMFATFIFDARMKTYRTPCGWHKSTSYTCLPFWANDDGEPQIECFFYNSCDYVEILHWKTIKIKLLEKNLEISILLKGDILRHLNFICFKRAFFSSSKNRNTCGISRKI